MEVFCLCICSDKFKDFFLDAYSTCHRFIQFSLSRKRN
ncbi:hypothetical protein DDD_2955 [Nonlabens dokdonensis DSW-6]|uniref:Uncharacterized protein n=1 Tax=Nonlabens dokdonensis (strain DSM 17205 / KCTC 12402 / DSW-6) TaxID=592029 RepID=L7WCV9_NONDD|nr:hypothetical protein DDD_2955 [Nonlabens dokdonensis DSW-6]